MKGKPKVYITLKTSIRHMLSIGTCIQTDEYTRYYFLPYWFEEVDYKGGKAFEIHYLDGKLPEDLTNYIKNNRNTRKELIIPNKYIGKVYPGIYTNELPKEDIMQKEEHEEASFEESLQQLLQQGKITLSGMAHAKKVKDIYGEEYARDLVLRAIQPPTLSLFYKFKIWWKSL